VDAKRLLDVRQFLPKFTHGPELQAEDPRGSFLKMFRHKIILEEVRLSTLSNSALSTTTPVFDDGRMNKTGKQ
jgi:hypothetical protein